MHEWALAEGVVATAIKVAQREGLREITEIRVKIGELQQTDMEIFEFALKEIVRPQTALLKRAKFVFEHEPAMLKCRVCAAEWPFKQSLQELDEGESESIHFLPETAHVYVRCPSCHSPDFEVTKGRGVWLESITGER
ncbi:MAG: hydrogenase nickel incorporation protein HypA [candidate division KSB1 bacterium]|nr:hydrogenase nickel incorporation protein HypA [candidate division KSB1 bacterium]MDZ7296146.1 hydrogenase nickel incorporation protein HypA [candidate division KSB1 bacterium]MDZ7384728.1 hydrogenase nickel incorporation protein HypA [candidate division KSB1 bacterium]MDZ7392298.1 hydrogenase nickel incorporation protein HypA [candidate division KSB1 bacterium]MDZ7412203.1 hydrogenase nickel incorporation protein HypA [candidate division KSB1 bacterium]